MSELEQRIERGCAWLNENRPGWERMIDLGTTDIRRGSRCVLYQVFGSYIGGGVIGCGTDNEDTRAEWSRDHGFLTRYHEDHIANTLWTSAILALRSPVELPAKATESVETAHKIGAT